MSYTKKHSVLRKKSLNISKWVIRIRKSKDRQHNGQKKKDKRTNNDRQNITYKTKYLVTRTPLKNGGELRCSGRVSSSCSTGGTIHVNLVKNPMTSHDKFDLSFCDIVLVGLFVLWGGILDNQFSVRMWMSILLCYL